MCFSFDWLATFLIWLVIIAAAIALLRLLLRFVGPRLEWGAEIVEFVVAAIRILIWAIILIAVIVFVFDIIACLAPSLRMPRMHGALIIPWVRV